MLTFPPNSISRALSQRFSGKVEYQKPTKPIINSNAEILEDAVDEIVNNAIDFGKTITFNVFKQHSCVFIEISNGGERINKDVLGSLFDYGVSLRHTRSEAHHGVGLFSTALRINILGGQIKAENRDNQATFIITLPIY